MNIWLVVYHGIPTPLKNDGVKVSWDDFSIPNVMGKIIHSYSKPPTRWKLMEKLMEHLGKLS